MGLNSKKPPRSYWLESEKILAGAYPYNPGADNPKLIFEILADIGIDSFIDLTEEDELTHYDKLLPEVIGNNCSYKRFEIEDYSVPDICTMKEILEYISLELKAKKKIYLHCRGGIGRTGTVAGCFLVESGFDGAGALNKMAVLFKQSIASSYTCSPETEKQRLMVKTWSNELV